MGKLCGQFGQINCCHGLWKVAQSVINCPIWSHCLLCPRRGSSVCSLLIKNLFSVNCFGQKKCLITKRSSSSWQWMMLHGCTFQRLKDFNLMLSLTAMILSLSLFHAPPISTHKRMRERCVGWSCVSLSSKVYKRERGMEIVVVLNYMTSKWHKICL